MKSLEALKRLDDTMPFAFIETNSMREIDIIEKELKALEIIKKQGYIGGLINALQNTKNYNEYNTFYINQYTQEEYDLLKEVLL